MSDKTKKITPISEYKVKANKEGYTMLSHSIWRTIKNINITGGEKLLLMEIITNTIGKSRVTMDYKPQLLAKEINVTLRFIQKAINKLTDLNIISLVSVDYIKTIVINLKTDTWMMDVSPKDNEAIEDEVDLREFE